MTPDTVLPNVEELQDKCPITPAGDAMVVHPLEVETMTDSGLHIPETVTDKPEMAVVVAAGPGRFSEHMADRVPMDYEPGDVVLFGKYNTQEIEVRGEEWLIVRDVNVLGTVEM